MELGSATPPLLVEPHGPMRALVLNRPEALNSLTLEMIRLLRQALEDAAMAPEVHFVALWGAGPKGFCAGGDVKALARLVQARDFARAETFFREEYDLDCMIHRYPKPVVVLADGIAMGGGLGLAAGADLVLATARTRMAMPETRIGFFPDVGATAWLSAKCPPGYPEFLGLTGFEVQGSETVRLGLATHLVESIRLPDLKETLKRGPLSQGVTKSEAVAQLRECLAEFFIQAIPGNPELDHLVNRHFEGKSSVLEIVASLAECASRETFCSETLKALRQRSPTALVLTFELLQRNRSRPWEEVFAAEFRAAQYMVHHPDYLEGVRARIIDKDDRPVWRPATLEEVRLVFEKGGHHVLPYHSV